MVVRVINFSTISANKLNPLGSVLRHYIHDELQKARADPTVGGVVLTGGPTNFSAGADMTEFASVDPNKGLVGENMTLIDIVNEIEAFPKPVVAAVAGNALGGGLEIAISCHYRVALSSAKMGLTEVLVGVIPGAGGTQRLPRLIGFRSAAEMITSGKVVSAKQALRLGLLDDALDSNDDDYKTLLETATKWAEWGKLMPLDDRRTRNLAIDTENIDAIAKQIEKGIPAKEKGGENIHAALQAVRYAATTTGDFEKGMEFETERFMDCVLSPQGMGKRHTFFAIRTAQKLIPGVPRSTVQTIQTSHPLLSPPKQQRNKVPVAVIGAGTMGAGIALVLLVSGRYAPVYLVDVSQKALEKGVAYIQKTVEYYYAKKKKWLSPEQANHLCQNVLKGTTSYKDIAQSRLVVEAVIENMAIKQSIFKQLDKVLVHPDALMVSNTSTLDINAMAQALPPSRRPFFAGWHFFSPAHIMKLVEIIVGNETSKETVLTLQLLTKDVANKIGVICGVCDGFCGNRMTAWYAADATLLLTEGYVQPPKFATVDSAIKRLLGMAQGIFEMSDLAGADVGYYVRKERGWTDPNCATRPKRYNPIGDDMITKLGRLGQKAGKGFYDYDPKIGKGRKPIPSPEMEAFLQKYVTDKKDKPIGDEEIIERVFFPIVNEGFRCLEEGIVRCPSDIDVVFVFGFGWAPYNGGPMFWADHVVGLRRVYETLTRLHEEHNKEERFLPSKLLQTCVENNITVEEYYKKQQSNNKVLPSPISRL